MRNPFLVVLNLFAQSPGGVYWAGPGSDTATEDGLLKNTYEPVIAEGVLNKFSLKEAFKPKPSPWDGGRGKIWAAHVDRNNSPMAVGQDSAIPVADNQKYVDGFITQRKMMARWRVTQEQLDDSSNREGAYRSTRTENMERLIDDIAYRQEFYLGTDGRGVFALINEASPNANTTLILDSPGGIAGADFGNRFLKVGMYIAAVNPANGQIRAGICRITACASDGTSVTTDAAPNAAWADNDYIVQAANGSVTDINDTAFEKAPWGIMALIDDGTYRDNYFGVQRSLFPNYKSYVNASTGALSFDLMQRMSDIVNQKLDGNIDAIWCHHSIRRVYILLTQADRRYSGSALMRPDGGTVAFQQKDLTMGEVDIKALRSAPLATMFLVDTKGADFIRYESEKGKWVSGTSGEILVRDGTGVNARHAWEAWWYTRYQLFARNPGKCARADLISGQTFVAVRGE
jgi:hypothetical protein